MLCVLSALVALLLAGCAAQAPAPASPAVPAAPVELRVSAATSLKPAFEKLAPAFEKANGAKVTFDFGPSGLLQKQIEGGAPADVFASASPKQVDALVAESLISPDATATFASNDLVVFVPKGNPAGIHGPADLGKAKRLTTGDPATAPHGTKAKEWLTNLGVWAKLQPKFVFAENAAQTLDYVARGEADAGIGFGSEVADKDSVEVVYTVPKGQITPIRYVVAPLRASTQQALAAKFVAYLLSAEGQQVLADAHFLPAPAK